MNAVPMNQVAPNHLKKSVLMTLVLAFTYCAGLGTGLLVGKRRATAQHAIEAQGLLPEQATERQPEEAPPPSPRSAEPK